MGPIHRKLHPVRLLFPILGIALALYQGAPAIAAIRSLSPNLLRPGDRPNADYYGVHSELYPHFVSTMSVPVTALTTGVVATTATGVIHTTAACYVPEAYAHDGWKQGLVVAFDTKSFYEHMMLCAYRFASVKQARAAYASSARPIRAALRTGQATRLPAISVGDQVSGFSDWDSVLRSQSYQATFRRETVVVSLEYAGSRVYTPTRFLLLAQTVSARLR